MPDPGPRAIINFTMAGTIAVRGDTVAAPSASRTPDGMVANIAPITSPVWLAQVGMTTRLGHMI